MSCPRCGGNQSNVLNTRDGAHGITLRRRACIACGKRFTTYEVLPGMLDRRAVASGQAGTQQRMAAWKLRQAVLAADPRETHADLGRKLGCTGARVGQIRKEAQAKAEAAALAPAPKSCERSRQAGGMWGQLMHHQGRP